MYLPNAFHERDPQRIATLVEQHPFATLVSVTADGPLVSHLPLLAEAGSSGTLNDGRLIGHLARANPHAAQLACGAVLAIFHGPHAYVSPRWYATPGVPTWNYAVVHITGQVRYIDTHSETLSILNTLSTHFEADTDVPWKLADTGDRFTGLTQAILAFEITILAVTAKFKLSQNRAPADQESVRVALEKQNPDLAKLMP